MNTTFKSTSDGSNYLATITVKDPLSSPASTMDAAVERINEVVTYGNIPNRAVEIVLPAEMKGTPPADYEKFYQEYVNIVYR